MVSGLVGLLGVVLGGFISWYIQKDRLSADLDIALQSVKTEHMAEEAVRHYLSHKGYTDRSFELLSQRLGGFEDDELRKLLVRAGAVRYMRKNGTEWWRLLSRMAEAGGKAEVKSIESTVDNEDLFQEVEYQL
jgi:5-bromo-4-chloroindolyl phosphate hydrolysis protein